MLLLLLIIPTRWQRLLLLILSDSLLRICRWCFVLLR